MSTARSLKSYYINKKSFQTGNRSSKKKKNPLEKDYPKLTEKKLVHNIIIQWHYLALFLLHFNAHKATPLASSDGEYQETPLATEARSEVFEAKPTS